MVSNVKGILKLIPKNLILIAKNFDKETLLNTLKKLADDYINKNINEIYETIKNY